jgi:hypothetical protein
MSCKKCKTSKCTCEITTCINPLIYMIKEAFSLVGTETNDLSAMTILSDISVDYSIPAPPPVKYTYTLPLALVQVLSSGISISNNKNLCCSDCRSGLYFIGNNTGALNLIQNSSVAEICCIEHISSFSTWSVVLETWLSEYTTQPKCCDTDFSELSQLWIQAASAANNYFYLNTIIENGIFETSSFNNYSGLGILFNYLQLNHSELTANDYLNLLGVIAALGIVVKCNDCQMTITSTNIYLPGL